ncbi:class I SAM-dependent methyltransferase [Paenibacillus sp. 481]|uniref:class I SAM-dependent methyltransferase n=1 Tax=Paenibacillus sp. 481 TaxID=2835869 RepID=UPI001E4ACD20|nr:class I SAM-dependent methyltransferase [Paenibacillus sp. 481]UHA72175.1 class I SAM-dependent methyltransferase [Paenibacillus sp. 481]
MENANMQDHLEYKQEEWDEEYKTGVWDYLGDITEYARYAIVYGYIRKFVADAGVLDMGCGTGLLFDMFTDSERQGYTGVDLSQEAVQIATNKSPGHHFDCADINEYVPQKKYDVVVFNESLHYVPNTPNALLRYAEHLTANGVIVSSLYSHKDTTTVAYHLIEKKVQEIEECGLFEVLDKVSLFNHNAGLKWYIHLLKKK